MSVYVSQTKLGQFRITLPAHVAELLEVKKGDKVQWVFAPDSRDLIFKKVQ